MLNSFHNESSQLSYIITYSDYIYSHVTSELVGKSPWLYVSTTYKTHNYI